eukprot:746509-Hanusia_phi.AAC.2
MIPTLLLLVPTLQVQSQGSQCRFTYMPALRGEQRVGGNSGIRVSGHTGRMFAAHFIFSWTSGFTLPSALRIQSLARHALLLSSDNKQKNSRDWTVWDRLPREQDLHHNRTTPLTQHLS